MKATTAAMKQKKKKHLGNFREIQNENLAHFIRQTFSKTQSHNSKNENKNFLYFYVRQLQSKHYKNKEEALKTNTHRRVKTYIKLYIIYLKWRRNIFFITIRPIKPNKK